MSFIIPACEMEILHEKYKEEEEKRRELERIKKEKERQEMIEKIMNSNFFKTVNSILLEHGHCNLLIGDMCCGKNYTTICFDKNNRTQHIRNVDNNLLFKVTLEEYKKAGYKIGGHGYYSTYYYKDEERTIYAKRDCESCEL